MALQAGLWYNKDRIIDVVERCISILYRDERKVSSLMETIVPRLTKVCPLCTSLKCLDEFGKDKYNEDGLCRLCKECRKHRKKNPLGTNKVKQQRFLEGVKQCSKCKSIKPLDEFHKDRHSSDERFCHCKVCTLQADYRRSAGRRNKVLHSAYGITAQEYDRLLEEQNGVCAICKKPEKFVLHGKHLALAVDHCHVTGAVRGLLCANCNRALGFLHEDPEIIENMLKYTLERVLY